MNAKTNASRVAAGDATGAAQQHEPRHVQAFRPCCVSCELDDVEVVTPPVP
jgi:hypothetical protein